MYRIKNVIHLRTFLQFSSFGQSKSKCRFLLKLPILALRGRGVVVIVSANRTEERGLKSRQGIRFYEIYTYIALLL
jgi:hypothetical protein